ncbi:MAG: PilZ domain-containing protein [Armatimonadetes bacterium]|nr:PilZ domain-containing protein [Armatimonadota bacterium]
MNQMELCKKPDTSRSDDREREAGETESEPRSFPGCENRRVGFRVNRPVPVTYRQYKYEPRHTVALNVSEGGLRLLGWNSLERDIPVAVWLDVDGQQLNMVADAVWQVEFGETLVAGLQFRPGQSSEEDALRLWIGRQLLS